MGQINGEEINRHQLSTNILKHLYSVGKSQVETERDYRVFSPDSYRRLPTPLYSSPKSVVSFQ